MADILESITELRYYRAALFPPEPGPDTTEARRVAAEVMATGPQALAAQARTGQPVAD